MSRRRRAQAGAEREAPSFKGRAPASPAASKAMRGNRKKGTQAELLLRKALWRRGYRYRLHASHLPGKPDLTFPREKVAVFVDGDFWHGRDWERRKKKLEAGSNPRYWVRKIEYNIERDARNHVALEELGWSVIRFWESEVLEEVEECVRAVGLALGKAGKLR